MDIKALSDKLRPYVPKAEAKGRIVLSPEKTVMMRRRIREATVQDRELRNEYPQFVIDVNEKTAILNDQVLDLTPDKESIKKDVELFIQYMDGYERFHGNTSLLQTRYFEFANWVFASPFMAVMRDMALRYDQNTLSYPVFGLLYGQSKAGKTSFLETLLKMMIGQKTRMAAPDFTKSMINNLRNTVKGAPIIVDDLTQSRFSNHAIETIKDDQFGLRDGLLHYPAVVISANEDVKAVAPEIVRRTVICRVQAGLTNTEIMRNSIVRRVQKNVGTAFYREYLRKMLEIVPELLEELKSDDMGGAPDILAHSSEIIHEIIEENFENDIPFYIRKLTLEDYFSEKVTGAHAVKAIKEAWKFNKSAFNVDKRQNRLLYNAGQTYDAVRIIKELPEDLEAHQVRENVAMDLDKAREFFGLDFNKSVFLGWFRK